MSETSVPEISNRATKVANRRSFLSGTAMICGLIGGYGLFAALAARFLFPARPVAKGWMFVARLEGFQVGASLRYSSPADETISITRLRDEGTADDFIALSSICPHLGCHVHWENQNERFFCPCHNGAFDSSGNATAGPPKVAGQRLARYPLKIQNGLLFIEVTLERLV